MTSVTIFSLATVFVATFAWFTAVRNVDADGSGFIASALNGVIESVEFHTMSDKEYIYNEEATVAFDVDTSGNTYTKGNENTSIEIGNYSTYGSKKSLMVLFKLRQDASDYNFTLKANTTITDFASTLLGSNGSIDKENNSISNVIQFYPTTFDSNVVYDFSELKKDIESNSSKFVTVSQMTATLKNTSISLVENTKKVNSIAIILSYNKDSIEMIYSKYIGNAVFNNNPTIYFKNIDFTLVA